MAGARVSKFRLVGEVAAVGVAFFLLSGLFGLLFYLIDAGFTAEALQAGQGEEGTVLYQVPVLLSLPFAMLATLGVLALLLKARGADFAGLGLKFPPSWMRAGMQGAVLALAVYLVALAVQAILAEFGFEPRLDDFAVIRGNLYLYLYAITAISWVSAALGEELLFRGFLMRNFAALFGEGKRAWGLAVALQAAIFGAIHINQGVAGAVPVGVMALVFGVAYLKLGRNLWPLIIAHGLVDTFGFTMLYLGVEELA